MISFACKKDIPALKKIWKECFQDPDQYIDFCFDFLFEHAKAVAYYQDKTPVSMLFLIPLPLQTPNGMQKASYIYAVATLPQEQGKGYSSQVLNFAHQFLKEDGYELAILVPAEQSLFSYYSARGYETYFWVQQH